MRGNDDSVSEVVGSILLVAVSVITLGAFGGIVLSNVTTTSTPSPTAAFQLSPALGATDLNVSFVSGTPFALDAASVVVLVNATPLTGAYYVNTTATDGLFHPGDSLHVNLTRALAANETILVLVNHKETGKSIGTAHGTVLASPTQPGYTMDVPAVLSVALQPSPLAADGATLGNLTVQIDASRGLALVASVVADLTPIGGDSAVPLHDDGAGGDALAIDGTYTASVTARNVTFLSSSLAQGVTVTVTVTDILGHNATTTATLMLSPPAPAAVVQGASYGPLLSSSQLGWLNFTQFAFRQTSALSGDQIMLRVQDDRTSGVAWSALVTFDQACGGVSSVTYYRDGVAGSGTFSPSGGCFPLNATSQLNLAFLNQSTNATAGVQSWSLVAGTSGFTYADAGITSSNHATVTFYGDSNSTAPAATGLGENAITWGPHSVNQPPHASFIVTKAPDDPTYMVVNVDASGSSDPDGTIASYAWDWGDGSAAGSGVTATHTYATSGARTITLTVTDNSGATATKQISVYADHPPTASFTANVTGVSVSVDGSASSDPDGDPLTYAWDFGDGATATGVTASHTYATAGNFTITLTVQDTDPNVRTGTATRLVQADRAPTIASATTSTNNLTAFWNVSASDPDAGQPIGYTVMWGDGSSSTSGNAGVANFTHTYASAASYSATLYVNDTFGLSASATNTFTVAQNAPPVISAFTVQTSDLAVFANASASDPESQAIAYTVMWGDGASSTAGNLASIALTHNYSTGGNYTVTLYVNDTMGGSSSQSAVAHADRAPVISSAVGTASNLTAFVNASASDPDGDAILYTLVWGDGATTTSGNAPTAALQHAYAANGTYTATLYVNDTSGRSASQTFTFNVLLNVAPTIASFSGVTSDLAGFLNASASDANGDSIGYVVAWGDGATSTAGNVASIAATHTYAAGNYTITLYVNDTRGGTSTRTATVQADRAPAISSAAGATSNRSAFLNVSASDPDAGQTIGYAVNWGDGSAPSTSGNGATAALTHVYGADGSYTATLYVNDSFGRSTSTTIAYGIVLNVAPTIGSFVSQTNGLTTFLNASASDANGDSITYVVAWGDGSTSSFGNLASIAASRAYASAGNYTVTLYVNDTRGGSTVQTASVQANRAPVISSATTATSGLTAFLNASASDPDGQPLLYTVAWGDSSGTTTSGDGPTASLAHNYAAGGTYTATLYVNDTFGASASVTRTITVAVNLAPSISSFSATASDLVGFANVSASDADGDSIGYVIAWGDGATSTAGNVTSVALTHSYSAAGNYTVTAFVNDSIGASTSQSGSLQANRAPVISSATTATSYLNAWLNVSASDPDAGQTIGYAVNWGDGSAPSTSGNGATAAFTHAFASGGTYTATLYVNDSFGRSTSTTRAFTVAADQAPVVSAFTLGANNVTGMVNLTASDSDGPAMAYAVAWGDGTTSTGALAASVYVEHNYTSAGSYTVTAYVNDTLGAAAAPNSATIVVNRAPVINLGATTTATSNRTAFWNVSASDPDGQALTYAVVWGDGQVTSAQSSAQLSHAYAADGTYSARVWVNDSLGRGVNTTTSFTVSLNQPPVISGFAPTSNVMVAFVNFTASDPNGDSMTYAIAWGDSGAATTGSYSGAVAQTHTYASAGTYTITLSVNDTRGGSTTASASVTANHAPVLPAFTPTISDLNATVTPAATDADGQTITYTYAWGDSATPTTTTTAGVTHQYALPGNYTITVFANDTLGGSASSSATAWVNQTIYVGAVDNSFASPGGTATNLNNLLAADAATATFTESNAASATSTISGCDANFTANPAGVCNLATMTWKVNSTSTGGVASWSLALDGSQGTPTADGALSFSDAGNGADTGRLNYYFNSTGAAGTTAGFTKLDYKIVATAGSGTRSITAVLVAPNGTSTTIGTTSVTGSTVGWLTFNNTVPDNFLTAAGQYLLRLDWLSNKNGDKVYFDNLALNYSASNNYRLQKQFSITPVPTSGNHYLEVNAKQTTNAETLQIQVFDGTSWNVRGNVTTTSLTAYVIPLNAVEYNTGTVQVRLVDALNSGDNTQSSWDVDYIRDVVRG